MCRHSFEFPEDRQENYNIDGRTLTGRCKCGVTQEAYGMSWLIRRQDEFFSQVPTGKTMFDFVDKHDEMC